MSGTLRRRTSADPAVIPARALRLLSPLRAGGRARTIVDPEEKEDTWGEGTLLHLSPSRERGRARITADLAGQGAGAPGSIAGSIRYRSRDRALRP